MAERTSVRGHGSRRRFAAPHHEDFVEAWRRYRATDLILRRPRCGHLEGWPRGPSRNACDAATTLRPRRWRQEVDVMLGGDRHHLVGYLLLHVVKGPEQVEQFLCRRYPEQHFRGLVGFVEDAVRHAHAE